MATSTNIAAPSKTEAQPGLPKPPRLFSRRVLGPSAVFTALAIGSGELIFWPGLSLPYGAGVLWIALVAVVIQYFINVEIGRYSLATGESIAVGATRLWRGWGWILLLGTVVPWLWPGWARAASQLLGITFGIPEKPLSIGSLILCGVLLALPNRVYKLVEWLQSALLIFIIVGVLILFLLVLPTANTTPFWESLLRGEGIGSLLGKIGGSQSADFLALLSGIVFAGAGGILNLGYGLMLCEKRFGMGAYARQIVGLRHSFGLEEANTRIPDLGSDLATKESWRKWIQLSRREHALFFVGGNSFTIIFLSFIFFCLLGRTSNAQGMSVLQSAMARFDDMIGPGASLLFVAVAYAILFTSEIGIIDVTSRLAAGILHTNLHLKRISASALFHMIVWGEIIVGIVLIVVDSRQPIWFLITTGVLNTLVMAIYCGLVTILNRKRLPAVAKPRRVVDIFLVVATILYLSLFLLTFFRL